jgi:hypothetical protein
MKKTSIGRGRDERNLSTWTGNNSTNEQVKIPQKVVNCKYKKPFPDELPPRSWPNLQKSLSGEGKKASCNAATL